MKLSFVSDTIKADFIQSSKIQKREKIGTLLIRLDARVLPRSHISFKHTTPSECQQNKYKLHDV